MSKYLDLPTIIKNIFCSMIDDLVGEHGVFHWPRGQTLLPIFLSKVCKIRFSVIYNFLFNLHIDRIYSTTYNIKKLLCKKKMPSLICK